MRIISAIFFLFLSFKSHSQTGFAYSHISTEDKMGLNSDAVLTTYQDEKGFIWVGTANGLQRFDGVKFISFGVSDPSSTQLPVSDLRTILPFKPSELILFYTTKKEVGVYNTSHNTYRKIPFKNKTALPQRTNMRLWKDANDNFFVSVYRYGILKYDTTEKVFKDFEGFQIPKGWQPDIFSFEDTLTQRIWFPCPDSGLVLYDRKTNKSYTQKNNAIHHPILNLKDIHPGVTEFFIDSKRRYWIFNWTNQHFRRCFSEQGEPLTDTAGLYQNAGYTELRYFFETRKGVLWLYGTNALFTYDVNKKQFIFSRGNTALRDEIRYNVIHHIMEDADGSIWIATDQGLYFTSELSGTWNVVNMTFTNKYINYEITDLLQLKTGEYWLTVWGGGVITLNNRFQKYDAGIYRQFAKSTNWQYYDQAWCMYQDSSQLVWIGCQGGKYILHHPITKKTSFEVLKEAENATIRYITGAKNNNIFIGTQRGHVIRYSNGEFRTLHKFNTVIRKILVDNEGLLWVATEGAGLYCLSADGSQILTEYSTETENRRLFVNFANDLEQLNDSIILCAAGAINFINKKNKTVKWLTADEGLPGNTVMRMRRDNFGYIWMITKNGLCRYNPNNQRITSYGRKDGVTLANVTTEADYLCNDNFVMFAGGPGLLFFKSDAFELNTKPPDVRITDFRLAGNYLMVDSLLQLPFIRLKDGENSFTINFSSLSFLQAEKLTYYYRLKGVSDEWINAGNSGTVNFTLLPPGKYEFEVYSETIGGIRSNKITSLKIHIMPPFWRTAWFLSTLLTIIALIAYAMHRLRIKRILAVEKIRNRVARDLHDDMGSTLSTINILSSMAKAKLNSDTIKTGEYINKISDNSQRMMEAMDDIVWAIKPANDSMHKVVGRMREFATNVFEAKDIDLEFVADEAVDNVNINMEARRDFFLIFKEAVNNAAKYSKCDKALVHVFVEGNKIILLVKDNGIGFDVETADSGNGLGNMQKRAHALKGRLELVSKVGEGTQVKLVVPVG